MRYLALMFATLGIVVTTAARPAPTASGSLAAYVAYDRDADKAASVGDEVRWFVTADAATDVTITCWTASDRTSQTQTATTRFATPLTGTGTPTGATLTAAGYCESVGVTTGGATIGRHWFAVAP